MASVNVVLAFELLPFTIEEVEKRNENTNENEGVTVTEKAKESSEKLKGAKFNCEKCEYETNKRITLKKHMNTKHGEEI